MDCERALGHPRNVAKLWTQLRKQSPGPDVLAEARMVAAGSLADRGDLDGAISLLATAGGGQGAPQPRRPSPPSVVRPRRPLRAGRRPAPGTRAVPACVALRSDRLRRGRPVGGAGARAHENERPERTEDGGPPPSRPRSVPPTRRPEGRRCRPGRVRCRPGGSRCAADTLAVPRSPVREGRHRCPSRSTSAP